MFSLAARILSCGGGAGGRSFTFIRGSLAPDLEVAAPVELHPVGLVQERRGVGVGVKVREHPATKRHGAKTVSVRELRRDVYLGDGLDGLNVSSLRDDEGRELEVKRRGFGPLLHGVVLAWQLETNCNPGGNSWR